MENMGRCKTCEHFSPDDKAPGFGSCARWLQGYGVQISDMASNEVLVENDEGWGATMGEDFGCVLHESSDSSAG